MTIDRIENLTYEEAKEIALETLEIKEHDCIIADFDGHFGYSVLVFKNGKHIYYANDYELHHKWLVKENGREALKQFYIDSLNRKLYTDAELMEEVKTYDEYEKKSYFLRNYWIMRYDYLSIFRINPTKEEEAEYQEKKKMFPFSNPVSFCYVAEKEIVDTQKRYLAHLESAYKRLKENVETFREMISRELANHEACITCNYTDALTALGLTWNGLTEEQQKITKQELKKQIKRYCEED